MASEAEEFQLRLSTNIGAEAEVAASALNKLEAQIAKEVAALGGLDAQMAKSSAQMGKMGTGAQQTGKASGAGVKAATSAAKEGGVEFEKLAKSLGKVGAGKAGNQLGEVAESIGKLRAMGPAAIFAGVAVAVVAVVAALAAGAAAITRWAVGLADTARNAALAVAGIENSSEALRGLHTILPAVHASTGLANDELQKMAVSLTDANVPAANLQTALQALATAKAGGATESFLANLKKELIATGKVPPELAAQMSEFQRIASAKLLSLDAQGARFKENIGRVFGSLKIEGFLGGLQKLGSLIDADTASGRVLMFLFQKLFQPLVDGATRAMPTIERVFLLLELRALQAYIAVVKFWRSDESAKLRGGIDSVKSVFASLGVVVDFVSGQVKKFTTWLQGPSKAATVMRGVLGAAFSYLMGPITAAQNAVKAFGAAIVFIGNLIASPQATLEAAWSSIGKALSGAVDSAMASAGKLGSAISGAVGSAVDSLGLFVVSAFTIGSNIVTAIANGIKAAAAQVIAAITGVVSGAIAQAKAVLGIKSPSRVFADIGVNTGEGMAVGVDQSAGAVQDSMTDMVEPPGAPAMAKGKGGGGKSSRVFNFHNCVFGGDLNAEKVRAMMVQAFHEAALDAEPVGG